MICIIFYVAGYGRFALPILFVGSVLQILYCGRIQFVPTHHRRTYLQRYFKFSIFWLFAFCHCYTHQTSKILPTHCRGELNSPGGRRFAHLNMVASIHTHLFCSHIMICIIFYVVGYGRFALPILFSGSVLRILYCGRIQFAPAYHRCTYLQSYFII